jgi:aldose 1-epimerase
MINADYYTPDYLILLLTGELTPVAGTPFEFRQPKTIDPNVRVYHKQYEPNSGCLLKIWTTEPGSLFCANNYLDGSLYGTTARTYRQSDNFALEAHYFPDSTNYPDFPSTVLRPGA